KWPERKSVQWRHTGLSRSYSRCVSQVAALTRGRPSPDSAHARRTSSDARTYRTVWRVFAAISSGAGANRDIRPSPATAIVAVSGHSSDSALRDRPSSLAVVKEGQMVTRVLYFIYGSVSYLLFLATFLYAIAFVGGFAVPRTLDGAASTSFWTAFGIDVAL